MLLVIATTNIVTNCVADIQCCAIMTIGHFSEPLAWHRRIQDRRTSTPQPYVVDEALLTPQDRTNSVRYRAESASNPRAEQQSDSQSDQSDASALGTPVPSPRSRALPSTTPCASCRSRRRPATDRNSGPSYPTRRRRWPSRRPARRGRGPRYADGSARRTQPRRLRLRTAGPSSGSSGCGRSSAQPQFRRDLRRAKPGVHGGHPDATPPRVPPAPSASGRAIVRPVQTAASISDGRSAASTSPLPLAPYNARTPAWKCRIPGMNARPHRALRPVGVPGSGVGSWSRRGRAEPLAKRSASPSRACEWSSSISL